MKKRQFIIIGVAIAILVLGRLASNALAKPGERLAKKPRQTVTTVFTDKVENDSIPIYVSSTGVLKAVKRIELFSEVQGVMEADDGRFKAGNSFKKGELLLTIRSNDQRAQLFSQKSSFESTITAIMPDLKVDYPEEFSKWEDYLITLSNENAIEALPEVKSEKLNSFLVGRGVYSAYHSLKNTEIINSKYNIRAPYGGTLIETNADPGTVIRLGQALGTFIQPNKYELETSIDAISAERLSVGQKVELQMQGMETKKWEGNISRLVKAIDKESQMSTFFVELEGDDLKEGMFLQAKVKADKISNAFQISRSALVNENQVYIVREKKLALKIVKIEHFNQNTVIVSGLNEGEEIVTKIPPSAFGGMTVSVYQGEE